MIDLDYTFGEASVYCDEPNCETEETIEGFDGKVCFEIIIDQMKEDGWKITKRGGTWHHTCPACVAERLERLGKEEKG